jgi:hypothetical protein
MKLAALIALGLVGLGTSAPPAAAASAAFGVGATLAAECRLSSDADWDQAVEQTPESDAPELVRVQCSDGRAPVVDSVVKTDSTSAEGKSVQADNKVPRRISEIQVTVTF